MSLQEIIKKNNKKEYANRIPLQDPYKSNKRQCNGKCPHQNYQIIKK